MSKKAYGRLPLEARVDEDGFAVSSATIITNQRLTCVAVKIAGAILINPAAAEGMSDEEFRRWAQEKEAAGGPRILRDVKSLKYEVIISEAPATPSARTGIFLSMLELVQAAPVFLQVLADKLLEYSDMPDRPELIERLHRIMPALGGGGPPQPPNPAAGPEMPGGTPSGTPPAVTGGQVPTAGSPMAA